MPGSNIAFGLLPANFGMWSGPGYAGGQLIAAGSDPTGALFRSLYGDTSGGKTDYGVRPLAFFDAAPRDHDLGYEYADRLYGATLTNGGANPYASSAAVNLVHFVADMDLLTNVFNYKPADYDFIAPGDQDFIGEYYKKMLVDAFYIQAVASYGLGPHMHQFWKDHFAGSGIAEPNIAELRTFLANGLPNLGSALGWGTSGLQRLATSDFLTPAERLQNLGLTQQEMMLFNLHLSTGGQTLTRDSMFPLYGGVFGAGDSRNWGNYDNQLVIPMYDRANDRFRFGGLINGKKVEMTLSGVHTARIFTYDIKNAADQIEERRTWTPDPLTKQAEDVLKGVGSRLYTCTIDKYGYDAGGEWTILSSASSTVTGPTNLPALAHPNPSFTDWQSTILKNTWGGVPTAQMESDAALFQNYLFSSYAGPTLYTAVDLKGRDAASIAGLAKSGTDADSLAARFALVHLEPFLRHGGDFASANQNGALDLYDPITGNGALTQRHLEDRARFLDVVMHPMMGNLDTATWALAAAALALPLASGGLSALTALAARGVKNSVYYRDETFDYELGDKSSPKIIYFGGSNGDIFSGNATGDDALYGGGGNDSLTGMGGDDYLEGDGGNDTLTGGTGDDTLVGGTGNDTYVFTSGDGWDWIEDADGMGSISYDGIPLSGGEKISENVWKEERDGKVFWYTLIDWTENGESFKRLSINGPKGGMFVKNWQPGQLGLTLDGTEAPAKIPTTTATLNGDSDPGTLTHLPNDPTQLGDRLTGGATNDLIRGLEGNDIVEGGGGDDRLQGGNGVDDLFGGAGNDLLEGGGDGNLLYGGAGDDQLWDDKVGTLKAALDETQQTSSSQPGGWLDGGDGNNLIVGGSGTDVLIGGLGTDILIGGGGDDFIYGDLPLPQIASWSERITYGAAADKAMLEENPDTYRDNPEGKADLLYGGIGNDFLYGQGGDDILDGGSENDVLNGGAGNDMLLGQAGNDTLCGDMDTQYLDSQWHGDDTLNGGDGDDVLYGNGGADRLFGDSGNDTLYGNEGSDILDGGSGNDVLYGNEGDDTLVGGASMDYLEGGAGDDTYRVGANDAAVNGSILEMLSSAGGGKDKLELDVAYNQLKIARQDNDIVLRWSDNSQGLFIENGCVGAIDTYVLAGQSIGWMELINRALKDPVQQTSNALNVTMVGGGGGDRLTSTGGGADIYGGAGSDVLIGRGGNNTYHYAEGDGTDLIIDNSAKTDAAGNPSPNTLSFGGGIAPEDIKLTLQGALVIQVGNDPNDAIEIGGFDASDALNIHPIDQFAFADGTLLTYRQLVARGFDLEGTAGRDMMQGTSLDDRISGGRGDDTLDGGAGSDTYLFGRGDGNDTIDDTGNDANSIDTLQFQDDIGPDDVVLSRVYNNLVLRLRGSSDSVSLTGHFAGNAIDRIVFADATVWNDAAIEARLKQDLTRSLTDGNDNFYGTDGDDNVSGLGGDDDLSGGPGNDTLDGGVGNDSLLGGLGDDVFRFGIGGGCDAISDAGACGNDSLELGEGIDPDNLVAQASGNDLILGVRGTSDQITLGGFFARSADVNNSLKVLFADGTVWNETDLIRQTWANAAKDGTYWGTAGDDVIHGGEGNDTIFGHAGNDVLAGDEDDDFLWGNEGDDYLQGGEGNDILCGDGNNINLGYEHCWYDERNDFYWNFRFSSLYVPDGQGGNDTLDGGGENDYLLPGSGNNVILFGKGDGKDIVSLYGGIPWHDPANPSEDAQNPSQDSTNIIRFKAGVSPDDISVQLTTFGELCVRIKGTNDGLYIVGLSEYGFDYAGMMFDVGKKPSYERLPQFQFADGTVWDTATMLPQMVIHPTDEDDNIGGLETNDVIDGGAGNDWIAGNSGDDTISGGSGNDLLWGGYGNDTFLFGRGDGVDTIWLDVNDIVERVDGSFDTGEINTLQFKNGISPQDIVVARGGRSPLVLAIVGTTDRVVLSDYSWVGSYPGQYPINQVKFADGTVWDYDKLLQLEEAPTSKITTAIADLSAKAQAPFEFKVPLYVDPSWACLASASAKLENGDPLPSWLQFDSETQELSGTPGPDDLGDLTIVVSVTDPNDIEDITKLRLVVTRENRAPVVNVPLDDLAAAEHAAFSFTLPADAFADPDVGDVLTYGAALANGEPLPGWLSFDAVTRAFSGTPGNEEVGALNVAVTATDQDGLSVSTGFAIAVANVNDAPVASGDVIAATEEGGPISVAAADLLANDSDADLRYGDVLSIASVSQAASGANVSLANGTVKYDAGQLYQELGQGETATDSFTYTVVDAAGAACTAVVSVVVTGVNDAPVATDNFAGVSEDGALTAVGNVLAEDYDIDRGTVLAVANAGVLQGTYGSLTLGADGSYQYRLNDASAAVQGLRAGQIVTDVFAYQATDGIATTPAALTVNVVGTNDAPVIVADAARMSEDNLALPVIGNVLTNDSDVDQGTTLRVANAGVFKGSYGTLTLKSDGAYSYALDSTLRTVQQLATAPSLNEKFVCKVTDGVVTATTTLSVGIDGAARTNIVTGGARADRLLGTAGNDVINGAGGNDVLFGQEGSDRLDGGNGRDTTYGGKGNDVYVVDNGGDSVIEYADEGIDTVLSSVSYALGSNVENLTLTGTAMIGFGNAADNALLGNASANLLLDGVGNDTLDGGAGNDTLSGGSGNDTYVLGRGYGADLLFEYDSSYGNTDVLSFQPGIAADQLWFRRVGNNLEVDIMGTTDSMTIAGWYSGSAFHVEQFKTADGKVLTDTRVQNLIQAMASFTPPPAGQTSLPPAYQTALQPVIAANWQ